MSTSPRHPKYVEGQPFFGSVVRGVTEEREWGALKAIDPLSGQIEMGVPARQSSVGGHVVHQRRTRVRRG